jgi:copper chaperone NosL
MKLSLALCTVSMLALAMLFGAGCTGEREDGPPKINLGRDECVECGMIISEERFSSALIVEEHGRLQPQLFDDIGDMLDYERGHPEAVIMRRFVHDYETGTWLAAADAVYVSTDAIHTPMGSGVVAFRSADEAQKHAGSDGHTLKWPELAGFRMAWRKEHFGR